MSRNESAAPATGANPSNRQRFLDACRCQRVDRPPVWLMRQAGRALPEYRALKEKHSFIEMVQTPELATEATLQPIRRFDFDAAILFSDILVICEALGQPYRFKDKGGIEMAFLLNTKQDIDKLEVSAVPERLQYVARALPMIKKALANRTALIGFAGSPWTLANYMVEGGGITDYTKLAKWRKEAPELFNLLMTKLTEAVAKFLHLQIDAGAEAVQIFDSLGGSLSDAEFPEASGRWMKQIVSSIGGRVPVIMFARGANGNWDYLAQTGASVLGIDWTVSLADVAARLPASVGVQGNLDPTWLTRTPIEVANETQRILTAMNGRPGHIFNLGHGVPPDSKLENIEALVSTVRTFRSAGTRTAMAAKA